MTRRTGFLLVCAALLVAVAAAPVTANSPYTTWTRGPGGSLYPSQDAYTPLDQIDLPVAGPEDMFFAPDGFLYIADTGNRRILKLDDNFEIAAEFGSDVLQAPRGVWVDAAGTMYIADAGSNTVVILDSSGALVHQFGRPTEPLFGANRQFLPRKIAVDARGNLYIVSESSVNGLVMMNPDGGFIGYFGANAAEMSLGMIVQRMFLNEQQLEQFIRNEAASPTHVTIDHQALVYTLTAGTDRSRSIRQFTVSGRNLYPSIIGSNTFRDLHVSENGLLIAVDSTGVMFEYDLNGTLLFLFGSQDRGDQRLGLLTNPTAIERRDNIVYVLDKDKNAIVLYRVTDFAQRVHQGVQLYMNGFYTEARPYFEEVLTYNGLVIMAYQALADASFNEGDYAAALANYRYAEDRDGYSDAFWELRNSVLQQYLGSALGVFICIWGGVGVFNRLARRRHWLEPIGELNQRARRIRLIDDFAFMFQFIKKPIDSFDDIKQNQRGSLAFALLLYGWVLVSRILSLYITGFVFNPVSAAWQIRIETEITYVLVLFVIWNAANYLVSTISDGEGRLRHVIIGSAYSLVPYALFALPIALVSNLLTLNEMFIYTFTAQLVLFWCGLLLIMMVKEIHNFTFSQTVRNLLGTLFTMAMFLLTVYILYILFNQLYEFVLAIIQEVGLRG
ncbi:MAG: YIP1 family protein [bacterium]|nr:YIP1 family protein [bacterium]